MKSKVLTYMLIISVIAVWGIIFYRIFLTASNDEDTYLPSAKASKKESLENYTLIDTATLVLNYRDPFLGTMAAEPKEEAQPAAINVVRDLAPAPAPINWNFIKYNGFIVNPKTKKVVSIITINNRERMMSSGESAEGVKLLRNAKDSVLVSYQGKTKYIVLK